MPPRQRSLPLNRTRRLRRHVVHHAVDALDLVDDARRDTADELHVERIEVRRHAVSRGHRAQADAIYLEEIRAAGLYDDIWQAFAVLLPVRSVGVMGDERTYENVCALRAVTSRDGMTADWYPFPHDVLARISTRIINEVTGINRVCYDVSSKPPATIEWE